MLLPEGSCGPSSAPGHTLSLSTSLLGLAWPKPSLPLHVLYTFLIKMFLFMLMDRHVPSAHPQHPAPHDGGPGGRLSSRALAAGSALTGMYVSASWTRASWVCGRALGDTLSGKQPPGAPAGKAPPGAPQ